MMLELPIAIYGFYWSTAGKLESSRLQAGFAGVVTIAVHCKHGKHRSVCVRYLLDKVHLR